MRDSAVIAIHSIYAASIYEGKKRYEFRRRRGTRDLEYLALYETSPVSSITGIVKVKEILHDAPLELWRATKESSGIDYNAFRSYFKGVQKGYAYQLSQVWQLATPVTLEDLGIIRAPQFLRYVESDLLTDLIVERGETA